MPPLRSLLYTRMADDASRAHAECPFGRMYDNNVRFLPLGYTQQATHIVNREFYPVTMYWHTNHARETLVNDASALVAFLRERLTHDAASSADDAAAFSPAPPVPLPPALVAAGLLPKEPRRAAVLAPLYARAGRPHLLFTVRSLDLSSHRGEISFPGGSWEATDATLAETALREAHEEIGLEPFRVAVLGALPPVFAGPSNFYVTPYVGWIDGELPALTPNPDEVAEVIEAPLAALADPVIYHTEVWERFGASHLLHFYDYGAYRIWGATGRMLFSLLEMLPPEEGTEDAQQIS